MDDPVGAASAALRPYGRDYALGAVRGLAVRNLLSVDLPSTSPGFFPLVKVHDLALRDLEAVFYGYLSEHEASEPGDLVRRFVEGKVWE